MNSFVLPAEGGDLFVTQGGYPQTPADDTWLGRKFIF